ncbi:MAG: twin-arginine translocase TatA/TatE family subunit [Candidatus Dormibacter sp.]
MPFINPGHFWIIAIVLVIVLIIWGPGKLPDVGAGMGRAIREFRKASTEAKEEFSKATRPDPTEPAAVNTPAAQVATPGEPAPVGGGPVPAPAVHVAGEGDHAAAS